MWNKLGEGLFFEAHSWSPLLSNLFLESFLSDYEPQFYFVVDEEGLQ